MRQSQKIALKAKLKLVRKFAKGFDAADGYRLDQIDKLNFGRRAAIEKYYKVLAPLTSREFQVYRPKRKDHLKEAQSFAQHSEFLPRIKVALIPKLHDEQKLSVRFDNSKPAGSKVYTLDRATGVRTDSIPLDPDELEEYGAEEAVNEAIERYAPDDARFFLVQCGEYQYYKTGGERETIHRVVGRLMNLYGADKFDATNPNSHYFGNWLTGLRGYSSPTAAINFAERKIGEQVERKKAYEKRTTAYRAQQKRARLKGRR